MRFAGWNTFELYESCPFDLDQVKLLLKKVPFDHESKKLFIKQLDAEFFKRNVEFLSNPLLAIMTMMTFRDNMDVPRRMHIFYEQAFNTLFQWHDATKAFNRKKYLEIDEFRRSFEIFCLLSYFGEKYEFSRSEIIELIVKSNRVNSITVTPECVLKDYEESVNLIRQEGLRYIFIHRSFQEYFAACSLVKLNGERFDKAIRNITGRQADSVLSMCFEINRDIILKRYISPLIAELEGKGYLSFQPNEPFHTFSKCGVSYRIHLMPGGGVGIGQKVDDTLSEFINNVRRIRGIRASGILPLPKVMFIYFDEIFSGGECSNFVIRIWFEEGNIKFEFKRLGDNVPEGIEFAQQRLGAEIEKIKAIMIECEEKFVDNLLDLQSWCDDELSFVANRDKSLEEILGV
jgi:hypothetical protein